jgi:RND superfamily putative drug exporter
MASALSRLGRTAFRRRRLFLATWLVVLGAIFAAAATLSDSTEDSFSIPGTESQQAIDLLAHRFPQVNGASGRIVFAAPEGQQLTGARRAAIDAALERVEKAPDVQDAGDPQVSEDGRIALAPVTFDRSSDDLPAASVEAVQHAARGAERAGVQVELGGDAVLEPEESGLTELLGLAVAALVLAITFGSLLAAGLPLLTALVGVGIGLMGITAATGFFTLNSSVPTLALMLGLAVGIDYALFIISRHRTQLFGGMEPEESAARAVGTAGSAVIFAGATVVIALSALAVVGIPFLTAMGLAAAATVAVAVLIAITLVPALLGFAGMRMAKGKRLDTGAKPTMGARWVGLVTRHRLVAIALTVVALGACTLPTLDLRLGLGDDDSHAAPGATNRKAYDLLSDGFGPGFNGPLTIVVDGEGAKAVATTVARALRSQPGVAGVGTPSPNKAGDTAVLSLIPATGPSDAPTKALVASIRARAPALERQTGARVLVTGQTAVNIDVNDQLRGALIPFLAVIVGIAFVLLVIAFRSVLVPLTAIGGFLLTIGATLGAVTAVFQKGFAADLIGIAQPAPVTSLLPIIIIAILFGLAMDYQVFLVSRMREEHAGGAPATDAVTAGFRHGARVVTAAALIMGAVFAGFVLQYGEVIKSVGFALAFGILVDAFIVRMTLIPALMALLGERAWWLPRRLDRKARLRTPAADAASDTVMSAGTAAPPSSSRGR